MTTDPSPLLSPPPLTTAKRHHPSLDDTIEHCLGDFGWKYILQATLVSFAWFFDAQQAFISVFTDAEPKWKCIPNNQSSCDPCQLSGADFSWTSGANTSIISEWSLQCASSIMKGLPASAFFLGCLVGGFALATLADSAFGRKKSLVLSSMVMSLAAVMTAFSTNVWTYSALRFVSGFGRATIGSAALVLSTEMVGKKWRERMGIMGFICFTAGFLSLPVIAFSLQGSSWRLIYLWTSVPSVIYSLLLFFLVRESPRWLYIKGRKQEFADTLRSIAPPTNRSSLTQSFFGRCTAWEDDTTTKETYVFAAAKMLLEKSWSCRRLVAISVVAFGVGMIYYGMPLGLGNLSINLYLSMTLNALSEFPASFVTFILIEKLNRREFILILSLLSGICSVGCVLVRWKGMQIGLELVSFFCACTVYDVVLLYTLELFPTCVRNSAVSIVRQALVFGGALSPMLVTAGRINGLVSYGVFGVAISVCSVSVVFLPETRGRVMCDTYEDDESTDSAAAVIVA